MHNLVLRGVSLVTGAILACSPAQAMTASCRFHQADSGFQDQLGFLLPGDAFVLGYSPVQGLAIIDQTGRSSTSLECTDTLDRIDCAEGNLLYSFNQTTGALRITLSRDPDGGWYEALCSEIDLLDLPWTHPGARAN